MMVSLVACGDENTMLGGGPALPEGSSEPIVTASGLTIIDIVVGMGEAAAPDSVVTAHYTGWLADGTVFSSSYDTGQPFTRPVSGLIPGWQEGIPEMRVGGKRRLIIPAELAYGETGSPPAIPPNAELTFDIELLSLQ